MCCCAASYPGGINLGISFLPAYLLFFARERGTLKFEDSYFGD